METDPSISPLIKDFQAEYARHIEERKALMSETVPKIHVDEIASKIARFYEKVRNVIDYREEHLLRKHTIERILRRRVFLKEIAPDIAEPLIKEIIRAGHLKNDSVPESKIIEVERAVKNLVTLLDAIRENGTESEKEKEDLREWLVKITVSAIEEMLFPPVKDTIQSSLMFRYIKNRLLMNGITISENDRNLQLFIAIQKNLLRVEDDQLTYRLLKFVRPDWDTMSTADALALAPQIPDIRNRIRIHLQNPIGKYFARIVKRNKIVFQVLGDLIFGEKALAPDTVNAEIKEAYEERYEKESRRLNRLAFLSVISFFLSKMLIAFAIEIPIDRTFGHEFSLLNLGINIAFPPFLMLIIIAFVRMPSDKNLLLVTDEVRDVLFDAPEKRYVINIIRKKGWLGNAIVQISYIAIFAVTLYFLIKLLLLLHFSILNIIIFSLFISMVIATGVKVYNRSKEISLEKEKASMIRFIIDLFTIPFMTIGKWVIAGLSKFNILIIAFNFLLELPFQLFIEFLENFRGFLKSKKEEIS